MGDISLIDVKFKKDFHVANYEQSSKILLTHLLTYLLTPWTRVLLEKITGSQLVKKFPHFMETEGSLPHSQLPATCPILK